MLRSGYLFVKFSAQSYLERSEHYAHEEHRGYGYNSHRLHAQSLLHCASRITL